MKASLHTATAFLHHRAGLASSIEQGSNIAFESGDLLLPFADSEGVVKLEHWKYASREMVLMTKLEPEFRKIETARENYKIIVQARALLAESKKEPFCLHGLARACGVSAFRFVRLFKLSYQMTPLTYHHLLRLTEAIKMIRQQPDISLTRLAYQLGYVDLPSFSKKFKKYYHMSPKAFTSKMQTATSRIVELEAA